MFYEFAKALGRDGVPQGFMTMSSGRGGRSRQLASPLSWTSFRGVRALESSVQGGLNGVSAVSGNISGQAGNVQAYT